MNIENHYIARISGILNNPEMFFDDLSNNGKFNFDQFYAYTQAIYGASTSNLSMQDRYIGAVTIWEINYKILLEISNHLNDDVYAKIDNVSQEQASAILDVLYYVANWFSYQKDIDPDLLTLEAWS